MRRLRHAIAFSLAVVTASSLLHASENSKTDAAKTSTVSIDLFAGMESGDLQVKLIPKNDREASLIIQNKTKQPLSVVLPDAFVVRFWRRRAGGWGKSKPHDHQRQ